MFADGIGDHVGCLLVGGGKIDLVPEITPLASYYNRPPLIVPLIMPHAGMPLTTLFVPTLKSGEFKTYQCTIDAPMADIIPLRMDKMTPVYKSGFAVLIIGLLLIEVRSIKKEHRAQMKAEESIKNDFDAQEKHMELIYDETESVLKNTTGGESRPQITPQPDLAPQVVGKSDKARDAIPLVISNRGDYPLTNITVVIVDTDESKGSNFLREPFVLLIGRLKKLVLLLEALFEFRG